MAGVCIVPRALEGNCVTEDAVLKTSRGTVYAVAVAATSSQNAGTAIIYDNGTAAAGERELYLTASAGNSAVWHPAGVGLLCNSGISVGVSNASVTVLWE